MSKTSDVADPIYRLLRETTAR